MAALTRSPARLGHERSLQAQGYRLIAGVDEVGRGSLAGPLVAASIVLPLDRPRLLDRIAGARDSKQLTEIQRLDLFDRILQVAAGVGLGWASHHLIDRIGLGPANRYAMYRSVRALRPTPDVLLLDAFRIPDCELPQRAVVHGDDESLSIAAASIVAKVFRDRWMIRCDNRFPEYGFGSHKGYCTSRHREALAMYGPCPLHRRSFEPVAGLAR